MAEEVNNILSGLEEQLKRMAGLRQDLLNLAKDEIARTKKNYDLYSKIEAKMESIDRSSINIKKIQGEYQKLKEKTYEYSKKLERETKEHLKSQEKINAKVQSLLPFEKDLVKQMEVRVRRGEDALKVAEDSKNVNASAVFLLKYATATDKQRLRLVKMTNEEEEKMLAWTKEKLDFEKKVNQQLGISGRFMGGFAKELGASEKVYESMVLKAREITEAGGNKFFGKFRVFFAGIKSMIPSLFDPLVWGLLAGRAFKSVYTTAKETMKSIGSAWNSVTSTMESPGTISKLTSGFSNIIKQIPVVGGLLGGLMDTLAGILDFLAAIDHRMFKISRSLGVSRSEASEINRHFQEISAASGDVLLNSENLSQSLLEMSEITGLTTGFTDEQLKTNIRLSKLLGIDLDTRKQIWNVSKITGKSMEHIAVQAMSQTKSLQKSTGISFRWQSILGEAAKLSGILGLQFAKYPEKLTKSLLIAKGLGFELSQLDSMANSFLDFESSISKEFEAQLLSGKQINLAKTRELALNNDLAGMAAEITKQFGSSNEFLKSNRIVQESWAEAFGMTRDSFADVLKQQDLFTKFGAKNKEQLLDTLWNYRKMGNEQEAIRMIGDKQLYNEQMRLSTQERLASLMEKLKQTVVDLFERSGLIDKIQKFVEKMTDPDGLKRVLSAVRDMVASVVEGGFTLIRMLMKGFDELPIVSIKPEVFRELDTMAFNASSNIRSLSVKDAVVFPDSKTVIQKDPEDYTIFTKNPQGDPRRREVAQEKPQIDPKEIYNAVAAAIKDNPIRFKAELVQNIDGQKLSSTMYDADIRNSRLGSDRQFGPLSVIG